MNIVIVAMFE